MEGLWRGRRSETGRRWGRASPSSGATTGTSSPHTPDFAILLPATEGLNAEVVRSPDLVADPRRRSRVVVAGTTTLPALPGSLRMGFQTPAVEQQAVAAW